jgi:6-phosphogluconolactonase (cycloisomerase 2 family)
MCEGGILYTLAELTNYVFAHKLPPLPSEPIFLASSPTMSYPRSPPNEMFAAEILIPTPNARFQAPYLYVSNRNDPSPEGDTIAIFSIGDDKLELVNEVPTGLKHVRGIVFGGPDSEWLIAGGVHGNGVKVFERVDGGKGLKEVASDATIDSPAGFVWM